MYRLPLPCLVPLWSIAFACTGSYAADVKLLVSDDEAMTARVELIGKATQSLDIAWFELSDDDTGQYLSTRIAEAAQRGVVVRLILDAMFDHTSYEQRKYLQEHGVKIRWFHPMGTGAANLMRRMHDKYLSADNNRLILGSRNIADVYFGKSTTEPNFYDLDLEIRGSWVQSTERYFDELWGSAQLGSQRTYKKNAKLQTTSTRKFHPAESQLNLKNAESNFLEIDDDRLTYFHDHCGTKNQKTGIHQTLHRIIDSATESILLVTPYFYPSQELVSILYDAHRRGVDIQILTNSIASSNRPINQVALDSIMCQKLGQLSIREYTGDRTLHTKGLVVDGDVACITSYNFNHRSQYFDTELALTIENQTFSHTFAGHLTDLMAESRPREPLSSQTTLSDKRVRQFKLIVKIIPKHF